MNKISFILFIFWSVSIWANEQKPLKLVLKEKNISEKVKILNDSARANIRTNPGKALDFTQEAIAINKTEFNELAKSYLYKAVINNRLSNVDTAEHAFNQALIYATKVKDSLLMSKIYNGLAKINLNTGNYKKAIDWLNKTIKLKKEINDDKGLAIAYNQLGNAYVQISKPEDAIQNYLNSVKIFEKLNDLRGQAFNYNSMGALYTILANGNDTLRFAQALEFYRKALKLNLILKDSFEIANSYSNIGTVYANIYSYYVDLNNEVTPAYQDISKKNIAFDQAQINYSKALNIREKINDLRGLATSEINLGHLLLDTNKINSAIKYLKKANKTSIKIQDVKNRIISLHHLAKAYKKQKKYNEALTTLFEGLKLAKEKQILRLQRDLISEAADIYAAKGDLVKALEYKDKYINIKDKIIQDENNRIVEELNKKYQTEKKEQEIKLAKSELKKKELENRQQKIMIYGFIIVILLVLGVVILIFRQYKQKKKANILLSQQKQEIAEKNEELNQQAEELRVLNENLNLQNKKITKQKNKIEQIHNEISQSIDYAKRIQQSILPETQFLKTYISGHFIFFKPRDIVSGDFYWLKQIEYKNTVLVTAADCTGHGVPGAFLSMLGVTFLNEIVNRKDISTTGEVLDYLRKSVITSLHQTGKEGEQKDGMDIAFLAINYTNYEVQYSGANNPLYIIRANDKPEIPHDKKMSTHTHTLYEIKADKMPIGIYIQGIDKKFTTKYLQLDQGDMLYVFSDGFADQFGGPKGKKFKYKPFKQLLLDNCTKNMEQQQKILNQTLQNWKNQPNHHYELIDDIVVIGIKL